MRVFELTIPDDYGSLADFATLKQWCNVEGVQVELDAIFDALETRWPGAEVVDAAADFSRIFRAPAPPPDDAPPLWIEEVVD